MTVDEFFKEFAKIARNFRVTPSTDTIRDREGVCPICAVYNKMYPDDIRLKDDAITAGSHLDMDQGLTCTIAGAADHYRLITDDELPYRERMLKFMRESQQ